MGMGRVGLAIGVGIVASGVLAPIAVADREASAEALLVPPAPSEVDVAFLGGGGGEAVSPIAVTATGNGVGAQLSSWGVESGTEEPVHLEDAALFVDGSSVQLHTLVSDPSMDTIQMLLAGSIDAGSLVLTTWRVGVDGTFEKLDSETFDPDPTGMLGKDVKQFALAHRGVSATGGGVSGFQLLTPVVIGFSGFPIAQSLVLRSFDIDATSGAITVLMNGPASRSPHTTDPSLAATYQSARQEFVVAYRDANGDLAHDYWTMAENGELTSAGLTTSGYTIDGRVDPLTTSAVVVEPTDELAMAAFGGVGLLSVLRPALNTAPELVTWETRDVCDGTGCVSAPFRVARNTEDVNPDPGVALSSPPTLTNSSEDSYHHLLGGGDTWGITRGVTALASGDVDGDGDDDLAIGRDVGDGLRYRVLGVEDGEWVALYSAGGKKWGETRSVTAMAMGDVDGDHDAELALGRNPGGGMRYQILDFEGGKWSPMFEGGDKWGSARGITAMAMGDVDNDGNDELAMGRNDGDDMRYQIIDYDGGAWAPVLKEGGSGWPSTRSVSALSLGDVDADGDDDLVIGRDAGSDWRWAVRAAGGDWPTMIKEGETWGQGRQVTALAMGDLADDPDEEIVIGRDAGSGMRYEVVTRDGGAWTRLLAEGGVEWGPGRGVSALAVGDGDNQGAEEFALGVTDGAGWRFDVVEYDVGAATWKYGGIDGGTGWGATRHPTAFAFGDVDDDDPHEELLIGIDPGSGDRYEIHDQPTIRKVRGSVSETLLEANAGEGSGLLYRKLPAGEGPIAQNASVGKFLTLLLAVEAIIADDGEPDLDSLIDISAKAAGVPGSHAGPDSCIPADKCLQAGDTFRLDDLLAAMMLRSDNRAAYAIAEYLVGSKEAFVADVAQRSNDIRAELGLSARFDEDCMTGGAYDPSGGLACFTHPAGSSLTNDQDLVTLWLYARQYPLFQLFTTKVAEAEVCGTDIEGNPKCLDPLAKFGTSQYPGLDGWKGGNGGHGPAFGVPFCVLSGGCLAAASTRLDRTMIVTLRQTGDLWGDHDRLVNWGYRRLFAPDQRATTDAGSVIDFGLAAVASDVAVTASLDAARQLSVCTWTAQVEAGAIGTPSCVVDEALPLPEGIPGPFLPTTVDVAELPTGLADGDFVTGQIVTGLGGPQFGLSAWRVGPRFDE